MLAAASSFAAATRAGPSVAMRFSVSLTAGLAMLMTPISLAACGVICGLGVDGYLLAVRAVAGIQRVQV